VLDKNRLKAGIFQELLVSESIAQQVRVSRIRVPLFGIDSAANIVRGLAAYAVLRIDQGPVLIESHRTDHARDANRFEVIEEVAVFGFVEAKRGSSHRYWHSQYPPDAPDAPDPPDAHDLHDAHDHPDAHDAHDASDPRDLRDLHDLPVINHGIGISTLLKA
jgi:hypothetical protein